jgi:hypothetical protein
MERFGIGTNVRFDLDPKMIRFFNPASQRAIDREVVA